MGYPIGRSMDVAANVMLNAPSVKKSRLSMIDSLREWLPSTRGRDMCSLLERVSLQDLQNLGRACRTRGATHLEGLQSSIST